MLYCGGAPKSGTNLLLKAISLFNTNDDVRKHHYGFDKPFPFEDDAHPQVQIIRNPRNTLISWVRFKSLPRNNDTIIKSMELCIDYMNSHFDCIADDRWHTVRFEELLSDPKVIEGIGEYLGLPLVENHFEKLWGDTSTFTNDLTDWKDWWTEEVNEAWTTKGGVELETKMNYVNTLGD